MYTVTSYYSPKSDEEILEEMNLLLQEVNATNGVFITLIHNDCFSHLLKTNNWSKIYSCFLRFMFFTNNELV